MANETQKPSLDSLHILNSKDGAVDPDIWEQFTDRRHGAEIATRRYQQLIEARASADEIARIDGLRAAMTEEVIRYGQENGILPKPPDDN